MTNEPRINPSDISELLEKVKADKETRQAFLSMSREDQLLSILGMIAFLNSQMAITQKENINYRLDRERRENQVGDFAMTTGAKIAIGIKKEMGKYSWLTDIGKGILQTILTIITLAVLYMAFGGRIPTP